MRKQTAVLWVQSGTDKRGQPTYDAPVQITCRWDDCHELVKDDEGETLMSSATVYTSVDTKKKDQLLLGTLESGMGNDPRAEGAREVWKFEKIPNFRATEFLRIAYLV